MLIKSIEEYYGKDKEQEEIVRGLQVLFHTLEILRV